MSDQLQVSISDKLDVVGVNSLIGYCEFKVIKIIALVVTVRSSIVTTPDIVPRSLACAMSPLLFVFKVIIQE